MTGLDTVLRSKEVEKAIALALDYLQKRMTRQLASHSLGHLYYTAKKAVEEAVKEGVRDPEVLRDIFISGIYHDLVRTGKTVSGEKDAVVSAKKAERMLEGVLPEERRKRISKIIRGDAPEARYLFMADYSEFTPYRAYSFGYYEHPILGPAVLALHKLEGEDFRDLYWKEMRRKEEELKRMGVDEERIRELREKARTSALQLEETYRKRWGDRKGRKMAGQAGVAIEVHRMKKALKELGRMFPGLKTRFPRIFETGGTSVTRVPRRPVYRYERGKLRRRRA